MLVGKIGKCIFKLTFCSQTRDTSSRYRIAGFCPGMTGQEGAKDDKFSQCRLTFKARLILRRICLKTPLSFSFYQEAIFLPNAGITWSSHSIYTYIPLNQQDFPWNLFK